MNEQTEFTEKEILLKKKQFLLQIQENNRKLISKIMVDLDERRTYQSQLTAKLSTVNGHLSNL